MTPPRIVCAALALALLTVACTDDGDDATPQGTPSAVSPTAGAAPTGGSTGATAQPSGPSTQQLVVAPQEPVERRTSEREVGQDERGRASFDVLGFVDDSELPAELGLALYPCGSASLGPPEVFTDADGDGTADDIGESDTGAAFVESVNGDPFESVDAAWPITVEPRDGALTVTLNSFDPDCAVLVVLDPTEAADGVEVDDGGVPTVAFGAGQVTWVRGS